MEKIHWAPKLRQSLLWQLYQNDARGAVDEDLLAQVGSTLLWRCESIRQVTLRQVACPRCGAVFALAELAPWQLQPGPQRCPAANCGWETTAEEWHNSWRHRNLLAAAAMPAVETFLQAYPLARSAEARMVCIDQLIHAFHVSLHDGRLNRSLANNLIEGSHQQVLELLDQLFAESGRGDAAAWRASVKAMWQRRRGEDEPRDESK